MGLNGTALATIISQALALVALAYYLRRVRHIAAPNWRSLALDAEMSRLTLRIGLPSMVQQALVSLGIVVIVTLVNRFGVHSAAAYGIAMRIDLLAFMPAMAIGMAASTLSGQNIGAHKYDRVRQTFHWGLLVSLGLTLPATLVSIGIPARFMHLFAQDTEVVAIGARYLRVVGFGYLMWAVMFLSNGIINGSGRTMATTMFTLIGFWIVRIPLALFLSRHLGRVEGIWYGILISSFVGAGISVSYYLTGRWKRPVVARTVPITAPEAEPIPELQDGI
jgi:putative MATE family efflux protein